MSFPVMSFATGSLGTPGANPSLAIRPTLTKAKSDLMLELFSACTRNVTRAFPDPGTYPNTRWTARSEPFKQMIVDLWNKHIKRLVADHESLNGIILEGSDVMRFERTNCSSLSQMAEQVRVWHTHFM
jgi:hypothetical protein